jgi:hypothetical protein
MKILFSLHWILVSAIWFFANGALHDFFILKNHKGAYNRDLLRLLMDGHVLILSGAVLFVCYLMMLNKVQYAEVIAIIIAAFMLIYCGMIFPFLKSYVTMAISLIVIVVSIRALILHKFTYIP